MDNISVLSLIKKHTTPLTIPYYQQCYNLLVEIVKTTQSNKDQVKWEWVHSHQEVKTPGEWDNSQEDRLSMSYMQRFTALPTKITLPISSQVTCYINKVESDYGIISKLRKHINGSEQKQYIESKFHFPERTLEYILWLELYKAIKTYTYYKKIHNILEKIL